MIERGRGTLRVDDVHPPRVIYACLLSEGGPWITSASMSSNPVQRGHKELLRVSYVCPREKCVVDVNPVAQSDDKSQGLVAEGDPT